MKPKVQYPDYRAEVIHAIAAFADPGYQRRVWVDAEVLFEGYEDTLTMAVHRLYDDYLSFPDLRPYVGTVLVDGPEVPLLLRFHEAFEPILAELGNAANVAYLDHSDWPLVVACAREALPALVLADPD